MSSWWPRWHPRSGNAHPNVDTFRFHFSFSKVHLDKSFRIQPEFNLNSSNILCGKFLLSIFNWQKITGNVLFYSATHSTQSNPNKKPKHHTHPPRSFTSKSLPLKTCCPNRKTSRPSPTFAFPSYLGGGVAGPLGLTFQGRPSLLACCSTSGGCPSGSRCPGQTWSTHPGGRPPPRSLPNLRNETTKLCPSYIWEIESWGDPYKWPKMNGYPLVRIASYSTYSDKIFGHLRSKPPWK